MWPSRGCTGSAAIARPCAVIVPRVSSASSSARSSRACANAAGVGESSHRSSDGSVIPAMARSSANGVRSALAISGRAWSSNCASSPSAQSRKQTPGATRPARPRRWSADARDTRTVSRRIMPERGEKRGTRDSPQSMTTRMPSIVRLVSAIDVASTIFRRPRGSGSIARSWASCGMEPNSGATIVSVSSPSASIDSTRRISAAPGRKTSRSPADSRSATRIAATTELSTRAAVRGAT